MNKEQKILFGEKFWLLYMPNELLEGKKVDDFEVQLSHIQNRDYWVWRGDKEILTLQQKSKDESKKILSFVGLGIEKIGVLFGEKEEFIEMKKSIPRIGGFTGSILVDFSNPFDYIVFHFFNELAEPYKLNAEFIKYVEPKIDETLIYTKNMNLHHSTGQDLVNIYFDKARDDIDIIEIELYLMMNGKERILSSEKAKAGKLFQIFSGLAYGNYGYRVIQYSKNDKVIESKLIQFTLKAPNYSGKPIVHGY